MRSYDPTRLRCQDWENIANLARLAPTPHNTQPFRIRVRNETNADLLCVTKRLLPQEDQGNVYVMSAFGIFAATMERAARHCGKVVEIVPEPTINPSTVHKTNSPWFVIGQARIIGSCQPESQADLLNMRRTSRLPFDDTEVAPEVIEKLEKVVAAAGHRFLAFQDPPLVRWLLRLNVEAIVDNLQITNEREEIRAWHRVGPTPDHGDGLWSQPMNQSAGEFRAAFLVPWLFALPGFRHLAHLRYLRTQRGTRHIGLLCGPFQSWPELIKAGRMLMELWLVMAKHNLYMQPFGSTLTNPRYAKIIARKFDVADAWLILRFGYSRRPPRAPRLRSILIYE